MDVGGAVAGIAVRRKRARRYPLWSGDGHPEAERTSSRAVPRRRPRRRPSAASH